MESLRIHDTLILDKKARLPEVGIICAHPGRVERIAREFLAPFKVHTNYRGFQVYTGSYMGVQLFVANTGIGAPAAAFLIEELTSFGAKRILRLGSNDSSFESYKLNVVQSTTLPIGLCYDYRFHKSETLEISTALSSLVSELAGEQSIPIEFTANRHIDGYFPVNFAEGNGSKVFSSQDMETGALYLLAELRGLECLSLLISYPKHETSGEYNDAGQSKQFEGQSIDFALKLLVADRAAA